MAAHDYPTWHGEPKRSVLICSHPRSGSTLLGEALHFAQGLGCPLEYFHAGFRPPMAERWRAPEIRRYAQMVKAHRTDPGGTLAVKLFWRDLIETAIELAPARFAGLKQALPATTAPAIYRDIFRTLAPLFPNPSFVHLWRRDRIRQAVSSVAAIDSGRWRSIPGLRDMESQADPVFDLDRIEGLIGYADHCSEHWRNFFAANGIEPHALTYEELSGDYAGTVTGVLRFLGSPATPPPIRMQRQADAHSEAIVLRYLRERATRDGVVPTRE